MKLGNGNVLGLCATRADEVAHETADHQGAFTEALIRVLRQSPELLRLPFDLPAWAQKLPPDLSQRSDLLRSTRDMDGDDPVAQGPAGQEVKSSVLGSQTATSAS